MKKQLTGIRDDTPLQSAIRAGNLELALEIISEAGEAELKELLSKQNHAGETALYVAAENGHVDLVKELIKYHDVGMASFKARNGFDAFHIAAKNGYLGKSLESLKCAGSYLNISFPVPHSIFHPFDYCLVDLFESTCTFVVIKLLFDESIAAYNNSLLNFPRNSLC